jgi:hypothetical protein
MSMIDSLPAAPTMAFESGDLCGTDVGTTTDVVEGCDCARELCARRVPSPTLARGPSEDELERLAELRGAGEEGSSRSCFPVAVHRLFARRCRCLSSEEHGRELHFSSSEEEPQFASEHVQNFADGDQWVVEFEEQKFADGGRSFFPVSKRLLWLRRDGVEHWLSRDGWPVSYERSSAWALRVDRDGTVTTTRRRSCRGGVKVQQQRMSREGKCGGPRRSRGRTGF